MHCITILQVQYTHKWLFLLTLHVIPSLDGFIFLCETQKKRFLIVSDVFVHIKVIEV